jgi:hypothetical protein
MASEVEIFLNARETGEVWQRECQTAYFHAPTSACFAGAGEYPARYSAAGTQERFGSIVDSALAAKFLATTILLDSSAPAVTSRGRSPDRIFTANGCLSCATQGRLLTRPRYRYSRVP